VDEAMVTESKFLHDRAANVDREVDIVIEMQAGAYPVIIGIECQGRSRVANVEWVEQMATKHATLPTNKLILVSQSGFSPTARKKAEALGIETMTLSQAVRANWNRLVDLENVLLTKWSIEPTGCLVVLSKQNGQTNTIELGFDQQLYEKNAQETFTVGEAIDIILDIHLVDITKQMEEADCSKQAPYAIFKMEFPVPESTCFIDHSGTEWDVNKLLIIGHYVCEGTELVNMQSGSYGPAQIAFGKTSQIEAKSLVSIVEHEKGPNTAAIMLPNDNEGMIGIIDLREVKE
jgi:hypothetical protein